jgi:hypothetical protein
VLITNKFMFIIFFYLKTQTHQAGLELTKDAGQAFGIVGGSAVGGLCGCCSNDTPETKAATQLSTLGLVCCAPCTMPCYYADNAALIGGKATSWSVTCTSFAASMPCLLCAVLSSAQRFELRHALGLPNERCCALCCSPRGRTGDLITHCCCMPCALVEERKILMKNGCTREKNAVAVHAEIMGRGGTSKSVDVKAPDVKVELSDAKKEEEEAAPVTTEPAGTAIP